MNELVFTFGSNSITYENGRRYVTINGKNIMQKYFYLNVLDSFTLLLAIKCFFGLQIYIMQQIQTIILML